MKYVLALTAILLAGVIHAQTDSIYTKVQITAAFPGGKDAQTRYFSKYGLQVVAEPTPYTAVVTFIISSNGAARDIAIENGASIDKDFNGEVEKAFKNFPRYIPAIQDGQKVTTRVTLYLVEAL